jgi:D-sedoheptulose 7-phosphate isomerase
VPDKAKVKAKALVDFAAGYRFELSRALDQIDTDKVAQAIDWLREARDADRQIFVCGNGGSAATASHLVGDLVHSASLGTEKRFRALCLNDSIPAVTALANDDSFAQVFAFPLRNFARKDDILIVLSGSGNSANLVEAVREAKRIGLRSIAMTGRDGGQLGALADLDINIPEQHMGRIQDAHMAVCHMICYYFIDRCGC